MINADQLVRATGCAFSTAARFVEPIRLTLERYEINTPKRIAGFLAQVAHESARFSRLVENLNYSADGLAKTWPNRFRGPDGKPNALALSLHRKPELIANHVYASRMGNGAPATGDGWKYRGRGLIQVTGKENYAACGKALGIDLLAAPESLESPLYAALSAGWYWHHRGLNAPADAGDMQRVTRIINGGTHGLQDRLAIYAEAQKVLAA